MMSSDFRNASRVIGVIGLAILVPIAIFLSPMDSAKKNQIEVIKMLSVAKPEFGPGRSPQVWTVTLGNGIALTPGAARVEAGYLLALHAGPSGFTITADPVKPGKTGIFSFFRDETGSLRFEPQIGRSASINSRLWGAGAVESR